MCSNIKCSCSPPIFNEVDFELSEAEADSFLHTLLNMYLYPSRA